MNVADEDDRLEHMLGSHPLPTWRIVAWPIIILLIGFFVWAAFTNLDEVSVAMRRRTGATISRSSLVRAMITAMSQSSLSLSACDSEPAIRDRILKQLSGGRK